MNAGDRSPDRTDGGLRLITKIESGRRRRQDNNACMDKQREIVGAVMGIRHTRVITCPRVIKWYALYAGCLGCTQVMKDGWVTKGDIVLKMYAGIAHWTPRG